MSQSLAAKERARWARIKRVYGLSKEQYEEIDPGHCFICLRSWGNSVNPCIDHDHVTGVVRGVLCRYCNHRVLGRHRDTNILRRVVDYLDRPRKDWIVPKKKRKKRGRKSPKTSRK
ncbi:MAG: endonuclease domain-containing protein [Candidatus Obscuribacterales bacterium]